jgi:hypothetical protein
MVRIGKRLLIVTAVVLFGAAMTTTAFTGNYARQKYSRHAKPTVVKIVRRAPADGKISALDVVFEEKANPIVAAQPIGCGADAAVSMLPVSLHGVYPEISISPHAFQSIVVLRL